MSNIPGTEWPLLESYLNNSILQKHLSLVPSNRLAPEPSNVFKALELVKPSEVKVIIIGQDPYIRGEAHGLSFSSKTKMTPSLKIIDKELNWEYNTGLRNSDLTYWADQGVLLLNTILTTELGQTLAHAHFGWQNFTREVVRHVLNLGAPVVVMLWGGVAQTFWSEATLKQTDSVSNAVLTLKAVHPQAENYNPHNKFVGCNHFRQANSWLRTNNIEQINWV